MANSNLRRAQIPDATEELAAAEGLLKSEWEQILERLGRAPNEIECVILARLWSEAHSSKSSINLLESSREGQTPLLGHPGRGLGVLSWSETEELVFGVEEEPGKLQEEAGLSARAHLCLGFEKVASQGAMPLALLSTLRLGSLESTKTLRDLTEVSDGLEYTSNRLGAPVVGGKLYFHESFESSGVANTFSLGLRGKPQNQNLESNGQVKFPAGSIIACVGRATGVHSSLVHADPLFALRMSQCLESLWKKGLILESLPVLGSSIAASLCELAEKLQMGISVVVDKIPTNPPDMLHVEVLFGKSAHRVLVVVPKDSFRELSAAFRSERIPVTQIGEVQDEEDIVFVWNHHELVSLPLHFANNGFSRKSFELSKTPPMLVREGSEEITFEGGASKRRRIAVESEDQWSRLRSAFGSNKKKKRGEMRSASVGLADRWIDLLANPNLASKQKLFERFLPGANAQTVFAPETGASVICVDGAGREGIALSVSSNSISPLCDAYLGAVQMVADSMREIAAVGGVPVGGAHCLNFGNGEELEVVFQLAETVRGISDACSAWGVPLVADKVVLDSRQEHDTVFPTPVVVMVGRVSDVSCLPASYFQETGEKVFLLGKTSDELGTSEYKFYREKRVSGDVPDIDFELEKKTCCLLQDLIEKQILNSARAVSAGGVAMALTESCLSGKKPVGIQFRFEQEEESLEDESLLFSESSGRFLVSCEEGREGALRERASEYGVSITGGGAIGGKNIQVEGRSKCVVKVSSAYNIWSSVLDAALASE